MTALVLLFLVSPGESDASVTLAMRQAAIQVLGSATAIVIRESTDELSDDAAILQGQSLHAVVVVRLDWMSPAHLHARLRVHLNATSGWTSLTGICLMLFSLLHNPCSTTIFTIYKETRSAKWSAVAALLPLGMGFATCFVVAQIWHMLGGG